MKKITSVFTISMLFMLAGCSIFISTPRVAHIEIQGLDNELNEYIIALDDPVDSSMDIHLTHRSAIQFDFQWLWDSEDTPQLDSENLEDHAIPPLVPWLVCKYRF